MAKNKESTGFILTIAIVLSLVCATLVSLAAVGLKPIQDKNAALEKKRNILGAAGIYRDGDDIEKVFADNIIAVAIDLKTGQPTDAIDPTTFNAVKAAKDPQTGTILKDDPAKIGGIAKYAVIYQLKTNDKVTRVILPIRGYGLWGTMFGFLAMNTDGKTIEGLTFYEQKETPGLGAEIQNPAWQAKWVGKKPYGKGDTPDIQLVKNVSTKPDVAQQQVDSLAGATLTSRGVQKTINFWLSQQGYGPYLKTLTQAQ
ncbi:MAG: Na(+)-translocating NADH-quinone reductase subunit C [Gammaproteobacteria bacterium]|nr:MAG: Na(+)-translocating NADH-quinone reductase subunit C [Gammaproteobacteria bacterium]